MQITTESIKCLREQTSAGIMECKRALEQAGGDVEAAASILRERGHAIARKKEMREATQGLIECYVHAGGKIGALVELNCESDFVARTPEFKELAHDLALQVVATRPLVVGVEDIGEGISEEQCLLQQPFIRDASRTVKDIITDLVIKVRENIKVRRFVRFELGSE
ncbi:MAG: elongation factor Ts [Dehalococcoidia bacterium]|nr:elongation factor Ts [Dehalococcoidia bacterium]